MVDTDILIEDPEMLLEYMRNSRKAVFHNSNIFFRDLQYSIQDYFEDNEGVTLSMRESERIAKEVARACVEQGIFKKVNPQGYLLLDKEYLTPKEGTAGMLNVPLDKLPPKAGSVVQAAAPAASAAAPAKAAAPKAAAPQASAAAAPAGDAGGLPAGAKGKTPPWLAKK
jgi:hypothetical protein